MNLRFAANLSMLFPEVPFLDRFALAAKAGFSTVEFLFPYQEGVDKIGTYLDDLGLAVALFDVPPGDTAVGEFGTLGLPSRRDYFRRTFVSALEAARRLKCSRVNVLFGNRDSDLDPEAQISCAIENLVWAAPQAAETGVVLLVESLNATDFPDYFLHTTAAAMEIITAVNHPQVKLQYDVYHAQMTEGNLIHTITCCFTHIEHIQIADVPGRHEPGTGEINYQAIFTRLEELAYQGYIGLEYRPSQETMASLNWLPVEFRKSPSF